MGDRNPARQALIRRGVAARLNRRRLDEEGRLDDDDDDDDLAISLDALWEEAASWPPARRDLLGLADAATRHADMGRYTPEQRRAIYDVWGDLVKPVTDRACVDRHIERFAELGIDIASPIRGGVSA